jgi:hypothetical protein
MFAVFVSVFIVGFKMLILRFNENSKGNNQQDYQLGSMAI